MMTWPTKPMPSEDCVGLCEALEEAFERREARARAKHSVSRLRWLAYVEEQKKRLTARQGEPILDSGRNGK